MEADRWLGVEVRHLAALQAVAREGSFSRAAARLGYTQSAVSQQIAALERLVGHRLLERPNGRRRVTLTDAGELVLRHADAVVGRLRAAQADLAALEAGESGPLRIGTYQSVGARVLPEVVRRFADARRDVAVQLTESTEDAELLALVEAGELDLAFVMLPLPDGPFEAAELLEDPYVLVVPAGSELARRGRPPSLKDVAGLPLIGNHRNACQRRVEATLTERGIEPNLVFRSSDNGTVQGLVAAGLGCALVPRLTVDEDDERVAVLPVEAVPARMIAVAWHRDRYRTAAAQAFVEEARRVTAALAA